MMINKKTILLTGGGTAGHVFGGLSLVDDLKPFFDDFYYIGSGDGIEKKIVEKQTGIKFFGITTPKLVRKITLKNLLIPLKLLGAYFKCKKLLKKIKPQIVFSKGGFVSVPVCMAAHSLSIPIVLHESDITLGLSNKMLKNKAKVVCTSFETTAQKLKNGVFSGSPVRKELMLKDFCLKEKLNINNNTKVLIVMGGSLGAQSLNELIFENLDFLCEKFFVVHITGKNKTKKVAHKNYYQMDFCDNMSSIYSIADFAITRGGANSLFELLACKIPMLISPLRKQTRGEQVLNANYFEKSGFALTLLNETTQELKKQVENLLLKQTIIKNKMNNYSQLNSIGVIIKQINKFKISQNSWQIGTYVL